MIIPALYDHTFQLLARGLRAADVQECFDSLGHGPEVALPETVAASERAWTLVNDAGDITGMFGVAPWPTATYCGMPWLVAADDYLTTRRDLVRNARPYVREMMNPYKCLSNFVSESHTDSIRWLKFAGFKFIERYPEFGAAHKPFLQFYRAS